MTQLHTPWALLPEGWIKDVLIEIDQHGVITAVTSGSSVAGAERLAGPVMPGMPNVHSHAFQRAMAGLTERAGPQGDSFWTWRELMYRFLERLTPDDVEAIATQLYIEMLKAGYTSVAEFHYLHHDTQGKHYANAAEMAERIIAAAQASGIALSLLPVFYAHSNFGGLSPKPGQRRFIHDLDSFSRLCGSLNTKRSQLRSLGIAPHSLRAVTATELDALLTQFETGPIHIHAAEQQKEVADCLAWSDQRPVQWLLDHCSVGERWCLIHCTHLDGEEIRRLAHSRAVAGLCPSTEGNLGDGIFSAHDYLSTGGRIAIGGDSHVGVDPWAELRWLEYSQRWQQHRRNVLATEGQSVGIHLYQAALLGGAQALGQNASAIKLGHYADLIVLNTDDPALAEHPIESLIDAAIFAPCREPVRDVMVGGKWFIREGRHDQEERVLERYRQVLRRLL